MAGEPAEAETAEEPKAPAPEKGGDGDSGGEWSAAFYY
jgi:hypothetical protein